MKLAVSGANGFIGRHVLALAAARADVSVVTLPHDASPAALAALLAGADAVIHLAGVNRPTDEREFESGNAEFTRTLVAALEQGRALPVIFTSSSRASEDTPYARSKRDAEAALTEYATRTGAPIALHRLPNVFGKWSRPFYNSAVATFCHAIARDEPFDVHDAERMLSLVYVEDVARAFVDQAAASVRAGGSVMPDAAPVPVYERSLGEIVALLRQFRALRTDLIVPDMSDEFTRKLYGTYVSFLPAEAWSYPLRRFEDDRGSLAELLKSPCFGQIFVSRTHPGITRGNHFHHTKTEKFVVVEGEAAIRFRAIDGDEVKEIRVAGAEFRVVDIPTGHTHSITNVGRGELVTLFWASEIFDPARADTYPSVVEVGS